MPWTCHAPSCPTTRGLLVDAEDHRPARRLERDRGRTSAPARRRSGARPTRPAANPSPCRQRSGHGRDDARRKSNVWPARTIAPAEQPARTAPRVVRSRQRPADGAAVEHLHRGSRLAARQVDEVGLADRLGRGRIVGGRPGRGRGRARPPRRAPPKWATPIAAQRVEDVLAIRDRRRSAGSPRAAGRARSTPAVRRRTRPSRGGTLRRRRAPRVRAWRRVYATLPRDDRARPQLALQPSPPMTTRQRWTLIATVIGSGAVFLDGTIVNSALKHIGQELPGSLIGVLEGQAYIVGGYLAVLAALLILAGRAVRPLRPAPRLRHRPRRVRRHVRPVRPRPDARVAGHLPPHPGRRRRPPHPRARSRSSPTPSTASRAPGRSASGRRRRRP